MYHVYHVSKEAEKEYREKFGGYYNCPKCKALMHYSNKENKLGCSNINCNHVIEKAI